MAVVSIPRVLHDRLTEEGASALVSVLSEVEDNTVARTLQLVGERFERRLSEEFGALRSGIAQEFGRVRSELAQEVGGLRSELANEVGRLRAELTQEVGGLRSELAQEIGRVRSDMAQEIGRLRSDMAQLEARLIRWMFLFWIGQFASTVGVLSAILFAFFKR